MPLALTSQLGKAIGEASPPKKFCGVTFRGTVAHWLYCSSKITALGAIGSMRLYALHPKLRIVANRWSKIPGLFRRAVKTIGTFLTNLPVSTGQGNSETLGGRSIGAAGGVVDFYAGAQVSPGSLAIIALKLQTADGQSAIAPRLPDGVVAVRCWRALPADARRCPSGPPQRVAKIMTNNQVVEQ